MKNLHSITLVASVLAVLGLAHDAHADDRTSSETPATSAEHVRIGALATAGFPRPIGFEAMVKLERTVAIGAEYSFLPKTTIGGAQTSLDAIAADASVFPFRGAFFVGVRGGRQHFGAAATMVGKAQEITIDSWFVNPRIGFLWTLAYGITLGLDAGVQIPVASAKSTSVPLDKLALASSVDKTANAFGKGTLPTVDLLRAGFLF